MHSGNKTSLISTGRSRSWRRSGAVPPGIDFRRIPRGKTHSSRGGRKAYLNFELKDRRPPKAAALRAVLDFKV
jgi:hypothetical protein